MAKSDVHLRIGSKTLRGEMTEDTRKQYAVVTSGETFIEECLLIYAENLKKAIDKYFWLKASAIDYETSPELIDEKHAVEEWTREVQSVGKDKAVWSGSPGESFTTFAELEDIEFPDPVIVKNIAM